MSFPAVQNVASSSRTSNSGPHSAGTIVRASLPSSLAAGDLLVAFATASDQSPNTPSGWTSLHNDGAHFAVFWKFAEAADVSAGTVDILCMPGSSNNESATVVIYRITGSHATTPINTSHFTVSTNTATPTDTGITPATLQCLFLIGALGYNATSSRTTSGYAVANSNPTWNEDADSDTVGAAGSRHSLTAVASANQTSSAGNATGTVSATFSGSQLNTCIGIIAIQPPITASASALALTGALGTSTLIYAFVVSALSLVGTLGAATASTVANLWTNTAKTITSWTNTPKP